MVGWRPLWAESGGCRDSNQRAAGEADLPRRTSFGSHICSLGKQHRREEGNTPFPGRPLPGRGGGHLSSRAFQAERMRERKGGEL